MAHTEWQFMTDREIETSLAFAKAHVERAVSDQHVEYYRAQVRSLLTEKRLREITKCYDDGD